MKRRTFLGAATVSLAAAPLATAARRLQGRPNVELRQLQAPAHWPGGRFDLIILSLKVGNDDGLRQDDADEPENEIPPVPEHVGKKPPEG